MKPSSYIKRAIIRRAVADQKDLEIDISQLIDDEAIELAYEKIVDEDIHWDYEPEFRCMGQETNIEPPYSRHYESKSLAFQFGSTWIGWTYWYGGGKHGCPGEIEWIDDAYFLDCVEKEIMVIKRTFTRKES